MFADIIVDLSVEALDRTFQYIIPKQWEGEVFAGCCVKIPFGRGNRLIRGYVMNITDQAVWPIERMKFIAPSCAFYNIPKPAAPTDEFSSEADETPPLSR